MKRMCLLGIGLSIFGILGWALTVTVGLKGEPNSLDPHKVLGRQSEAFLANIFDGLTSRDEAGNLLPGLAISWENLDAYTWRFHLRQGVKFHNGEDFTAYSVKFTIERALNPAAKATIWSQLGPIKEVVIIDEYTVDIITSVPDILMPKRFGDLFGAMLPPKYTQEAGDEFGLKPVGTGPFKLVEWIKNERIVLEANKEYWKGAPAVDRIIVRPISEDATRIAALLSGEVQLIDGVPPVMRDVIKKMPGLDVLSVLTSRVFYIALDPNTPPLNDIRVRQALNYAIDRKAIIDRLYLGEAVPAATIVARQAWGFDPKVEPYPYDPDKAKELLAAAGYPNGFEIEFDYFTGSIADHYSPALAVIGYLTNIGIKVKANLYDFGVFTQKRSANQAAPMYIYSLGDVFLEPYWLVEWLMAGDMSRRYNNPQARALVDQIKATFDPQARLPLYSELQRIMKEDAQHIFLFQVGALWGINKNEITYIPRPDDVIWLYSIKPATGK